MNLNTETQDAIKIKDELAYIQNHWHKSGEWLLTNNLNKVQLKTLDMALEQFKKGNVSKQVLLQHIDSLIDIKINDSKYGTS